MFPLIGHIGPFPFYSYGLMLAVAIMTSSFLLARDAKRIGVPAEMVFDLVFWVVLCGILGARVFYIFLNFSYFWNDPLEAVMFWKGGLAWQGSLAGGVLSGIVFIRRNKLPLWPLLDASAPFIALGHAIGRIGCLLNGCCYGAPAAWGLYFPVWESRLIPTQLFMSLGQLTIFLLLRWQYVRGHTPNSGVPTGESGVCPRNSHGGIFIAYLMLSSVERFIIEFFRADHRLYGPFSIFQYVCLAIFAIAWFIAGKLCRTTR